MGGNWGMLGFVLYKSGLVKLWVWTASNLFFAKNFINYGSLLFLHIYQDKPGIGKIDKITYLKGINFVDLDRILYHGLYT